MGKLHPGSSLSANLSEEPEHPPHNDPHKGHHWESHLCQLGTSGNPLMKTLGESTHYPKKAKGWTVDELDLEGLKD